MAKVAYTVVAALPDQGTASEYAAWLQDGHVAQVIAAGAESGLVIRQTEPPHPIRIETRYVFATREALERYIQTAAPALRAAGLQRFGPERGISFERRIGEIL